MKRIAKHIALIMAFVSCFLSFTSYAFAQSDNNKHNSLANTVYLTNSKENAKISTQNGITVTSIKNINSHLVNDSNITIIDFDDVFNNEEFATEVSNQIKSGKKFYIRATEYSANSEIISKLLNIPNTGGKILEADKSGNYARIGTFGYIVFIDSNGNSQIIRQLRAFADDESTTEDKTKQITNEENNSNTEISKIKKAFENAPNLTYSDELDAIDSFLTAYSKRSVNGLSSKNNGIRTQSTFKDYAYEKLYDTTYWYAKVRTSSSSTTYNKKVGAITRVMYAKRLYCAKANWSNPNYITSKWAYMCDTYMQPTWSQSKAYRSMNRSLNVSYSTYPTGSNNDTYKMILRDFTPKDDLSGKTDVTLSVGVAATTSEKPGLTGSAGFNVKTSFNDVKIAVPNWQAGLSHSQNIATIKFDIGGKFDRMTSKAVMTSTISLPSGVVLWNYANKYSCIQFNYNAYWYINNGATNVHDTSKKGSGALVWQPAKLY